MFAVLAKEANSQVIPDNALPSNTIVTTDGNNYVITGGTLRQGGNLFHSFGEFSLVKEQTAYFDNNIDIRNIFARITGSNISNIDGLIRANGTANLFLKLDRTITQKPFEPPGDR